jgi:hypothetical protein
MNEDMDKESMVRDYSRNEMEKREGKVNEKS